MAQLQEFIGHERDLGVLGWAIRQFALQLGASTVGALHVTCSDEAESECVEAFQRWFVAGTLPDLKDNRRAPMRTANIAGRYEWGSVVLLDEHFSTPGSRQTLKLLVVKINSHVAVRQLPEGPDYGWSERYGIETPCCGGLEALLAGSPLPPIRELAATFSHDGRNRVGLLLDMGRVPLGYRAVYAAAVNAQLQAQRAVADIRGRRPRSPTIFLVLPAVTINRPGPDGEMLLGEFGIDWTESRPVIRYRGLGDDPSRYHLRHDGGHAVLSDDHWTPR
ncbi:MAG: hypothetical protein ACOY3P_24690 [Planctomycetota bacterium]